MSEETHVDDFIDYGNISERGREDRNASYARWVLAQFRFPASLRMSVDEFVLQHKLFCNFEGKRYRVTGASRMGDIWLTDNFNQSQGYQKRVAVDDCSNWGREKEQREAE
ncbi:hypothetical protein [Kiloniella antarctica]|uniref:Uncharacterized protein n=1 Tax=Kiloniella antarctica TaxID=1550907 RepID=A0ABW5BP06_9PROT